MSDVYPFVEPPKATPSPQMGGPGIMQEWNDALGDPTVRASLLQFGISMLQPPSFGDTFGSQVGRAIGSAGEAQTARTEEQRKQQEADSRSTLREARATAAESRARESGASLDVKRQGLELGQQRLSLSEMFQKQRRHRDAVNAYNTMTKLLPFGTTPPSFSDWAEKNGFADVKNGPYDTGSVGAGTSTPAPTTDVTEARRQGQLAIQKRPDLAEQIRARFRQVTGQEPDF